MGQLLYSSATEIENGEVDGDVTINEALWRLEWFGHRVVQEVYVSEPPASVTAGWAYICATASVSSVWAGQNRNVAHYFRSSWHFYTPRSGLKVTDASSFVTHYFNGSANAWEVYASAP